MKNMHHREQKHESCVPWPSYDKIEVHISHQHIVVMLANTKELYTSILAWQKTSKAWKLKLYLQFWWRNWWHSVFYCITTYRTRKMAFLCEIRYLLRKEYQKTLYHMSQAVRWKTEKDCLFVFCKRINSTLTSNYSWIFILYR